jgi:DNA-directed RNA polymerase II subunit RPB2
MSTVDPMSSSEILGQIKFDFAAQLDSLILEYIDYEGFAEHHIKSYDHFITKLVPTILKELGTFSSPVKSGGHHEVVFENPVFESPTVRNSDHHIYPLHPNEALLRRLTYGISMYVDITHKLFDADKAIVFSRRYLHNSFCNIPCIVGSRFCYLRQRQPELFKRPELLRSCTLGYFIVSGQEKVLVSQETLRTNWPCCTVSDKGARCEVRSLNSQRWRSTSTILLNLSRNVRKGVGFQVSVPFVNSPVSLYVVFAALGVPDIAEIIRLCDHRKFLEPLLESQQLLFTKSAGSRDTCFRQQALRTIAHAHGRVNMFEGAEESSVESSDDITNIEVSAGPVDEVDEPEHPSSQFGGFDCAVQSAHCAVELSQSLEPNRCLEPNADSVDQSLQNHAMRQIQHIFDVEVFPHIGLMPQDSIKKARFLGLCVKKLISVFIGTVSPDDRDHCMNKRVQPAGVLLAVLFRQIFRKMLNQLSLHLSKLPINRVQFEHIINYCEMKQVSSCLRYSLATGNWGIMKAGCSIVGVSQALQRDRIGTISQLRRTNTNLNRDGKQPKPRQLYENKWGVICPCETPEGKSCGLVKAMALLSVMQIDISSETLIRQLRLFVPPALLVDCRDCAISPGNEPVMVNGEIIGMTARPRDLRFCVRGLKYRNAIPSLVSISSDYSGIHINCDSGTLFRPLFHIPKLLAYIAKSGVNVNWRSPGSWDSLRRSGVIVYMDKAEDAKKYIHPDIFTFLQELRKGPQPGKIAKYAEIHPASFLGLPANLIPFADMNQAPRNIYSTCMTKQAMGIPCLDYEQRCDPTSYVLSYAQRPIVSTLGDRIANTVELPTGINAVVCIKMQDGDNIEDALIINQAAVDRGLFDLNIYRTYTDEVSPNASEGQKFCIPKKLDTYGLRSMEYSTLEEDGIVAPGTILQHGDPVIGKTVTIESSTSDTREKTTIDRSITVKHQHETSTVVSCRVCTTPNNNCVVHVTTASRRKVFVGDKFASRHAQKGVCSRLASPEDMPFSEMDGMIPDIIISPCALPSRMTIGQLQESIFGKHAALAGKIADATPFIKPDVAGVKAALRLQGFNSNGTQRFRCGKTGQLLECEIFCGIVYYQRLKHMVCDKLHARATGPVHDLTRQPPHGRGRNGGFRLGEMERDAMIAHGAAGFLTDRYLYNSDRFDTVICKKCGQFAVPARPTDAKYTFSAGTAYCRLCQSCENVVPIVLPYCFKLLVQELQAMNIFVEVNVSN